MIYHIFIYIYIYIYIEREKGGERQTDRRADIQIKRDRHRQTNMNNVR